MPSTNQVGGSLSYEPHPDIVNDHGENPSRFLAMTQPLTSLAIIRGIDDIGRLNAWRAVELSEFGGRGIVLDVIDERMAELQEDAE